MKEKSHSNVTFTRKHHLNGHIASVHDKKKTNECSICDAKFFQKHHLKYHIASVHEKKVTNVTFAMLPPQQNRA